MVHVMQSNISGKFVDRPGNHLCQGCLADTRWTMQQQVADPVSGNGAAQESTLRQDRPLAGELLQGSGPHPVGQGRLSLTQLITVMGKQVGGHADIGVRQF